MHDDLNSQIRRVLAAHAGLPGGIDSLPDQADLLQAGMTSYASVSVLFALEEAFDIQFPDSMLDENVFRSIATITAAIAELELDAA